MAAAFEVKNLGPNVIEFEWHREGQHGTYFKVKIGETSTFHLGHGVRATVNEIGGKTSE